MNQHRKNQILEKLAVGSFPGPQNYIRATANDPTKFFAVPGAPAGTSNVAANMTAGIKTDPAVASYQGAKSTTVPFDEYLNQTRAQEKSWAGPTIGAAPTGSGTQDLVQRTRDRFESDMAGTIKTVQNRLDSASPRYDERGIPRSGMKDTSLDVLVRRGGVPTGSTLYKYDALGQLSPVRDSDQGSLGPTTRLAIGPEPFEAVSGRLLRDKIYAPDKKFYSALEESAPILEARARGETDPYVQASPFQRSVMDFAKKFAPDAKTLSAADKYRSTQDALEDQIRRDLPSFLGGMTEREIRANKVLRDYRRATGEGYGLDNITRALPFTWGRVAPNPLAPFSAAGNAVEGVGRLARDPANRNELERLYGRGSAQTNPQFVSMRSSRNLALDRQRAEELKQQTGGYANPMNWIAIPGRDPVEDVVANWAPTGRIPGLLGSFVRGASFVGSPFGASSLIGRGMVPRPGQGLASYGRQMGRDVGIAAGLQSMTGSQDSAQGRAALENLTDAAERRMLEVLQGPAPTDWSRAGNTPQAPATRQPLIDGNIDRPPLYGPVRR